MGLSSPGSMSDVGKSCTHASVSIRIGEKAGRRAGATAGVATADPKVVLRRAITADAAAGRDDRTAPAATKATMMAEQSKTVGGEGGGGGGGAYGGYHGTVSSEKQGQIGGVDGEVCGDGLQ